MVRAHSYTDTKANNRNTDSTLASPSPADIVEIITEHISLFYTLISCHFIHELAHWSL